MKWIGPKSTETESTHNYTQRDRASFIFSLFLKYAKFPGRGEAEVAANVKL